MKEILFIITLSVFVPLFSYSQNRPKNKVNNTPDTVKHNWCPDGIHTYKQSIDECPPLKKMPSSKPGYVQCWDGSWVTNTYACPPQPKNSNVRTNTCNHYFDNIESYSSFGTAIQTDYDSIGTFQGCNTISVVKKTNLLTNEKNGFINIALKDFVFWNGTYWEYPTSEIDKQGIPVRNFLLDSNEIHNLIILLKLLQKKEYPVTWKADGMHTKPMQISFVTKSGLNLYAIKPEDKNDLDIFFLFLDELSPEVKKVQTQSSNGLYWDGKDFMPNFLTNKATDVKFLCPGGFLPDWNGNCPTSNLSTTGMNDLLQLLIVAESRLYVQLKNE